MERPRDGFGCWTCVWLSDEMGACLRGSDENHPELVWKRNEDLGMKVCVCASSETKKVWKVDE